MKRILPYLVILIAMLALAACGVQRSAATPPPSIINALPQAGGGAPVQQNFASAPQLAPSDGAVTNAVPASGTDTGASSTNRLVIENADISIVVSDVETRMKDIQIMAQQMGGYVVSSNLYRNYTSNYVEVPEAQVVIRVPSVKLDDALTAIKKDVVDVQSETRSGKDVTAEYVDLQSHLKNLEAAEAQLEEIMKQATTTEDVVNVFNQLTSYRDQIEQVKGQIKYYEEAAALSAITVSIVAEAKAKPIEIGGWEPKGVALKAVQDLIYYLQNFVDFLIRFVIYTLPVLITICVPLYLVFLGVRVVFRKLRGNKKKEQAPVVDEKK